MALVSTSFLLLLVRDLLLEPMHLLLVAWGLQVFGGGQWPPEYHSALWRLLLFRERGSERRTSGVERQQMRSSAEFYFFSPRRVAVICSMMFLMVGAILVVENSGSTRPGRPNQMLLATGPNLEVSRVCCNFEVMYMFSVKAFLVRRYSKQDCFFFGLD